MPEIKNTFLGGKMNKSLDDRLLPEGQYRDALNVQVTKNDDGSESNVGVLHNIKGNDLAHTTLGLSSSYSVIGAFFDDKNNRVFFFVTDGDDDHRIYTWSESSDPMIISQGAFLNFSKTNLITGVNLLEDLLFWTDGKNQPRRLNVQTAIDNLPSIYYNSEIKVSVAKYAPYKAPQITNAENDPNIRSERIKEEFVRFAYRYKFKGGEYSILSPFSAIAFRMESNIIGTDSNYWSSSELLDVSSATEVPNMVNNVNKITMNIPLPDSTEVSTGAKEDFEIEKIDILYKEADSPAIRVVDTIDVSDANTTGAQEYIYKSTIFKSTLPEDQLTRAYDNVPLKAIAQEVAGNRVVYANITQKQDLPTIDYTVTYSEKSEAKKSTDDTNIFRNQSVKQRRSYEVGVVLADIFGRTSPVILSSTSTIYVDPKGKLFDNSIFDGDSLKISIDSISNTNLYDATDNPTGWYSLRVVVKQKDQEYYNVYTPGIWNYGSPKSYFTIHGDNINKVPRDTANSNDQDQFAPSSVRLYPKVLNIRTAYDADYTYRNAVSGLIDIKDIGNLNEHSLLHVTKLYEDEKNHLIGRIDGFLGTEYIYLRNEGDFAVFETEPFESALDIYYETPTCIKISDIDTNAYILDDFSVDHDTLTKTSADFSESNIEGSMPCSLHPLDGDGNEIPGSLITFTINSQDVADRYDIRYDANSAHWEIYLKNGFAATAATNNYTINLTATGLGATVTSDITIPEINAVPLISSEYSTLVFDISTRTSNATLTADNIVFRLYGSNGSGDVIENKSGLTFELTYLKNVSDTGSTAAEDLVEYGQYISIAQGYDVDDQGNVVTKEGTAVLYYAADFSSNTQNHNDTFEMKFKVTELSGTVESSEITVTVTLSNGDVVDSSGAMSGQLYYASGATFDNAYDACQDPVSSINWSPKTVYWNSTVTTDPFVVETTEVSPERMYNDFNLSVPASSGWYKRTDTGVIGYYQITGNEPDSFKGWYYNTPDYCAGITEQEAVDNTTYTPPSDTSGDADDPDNPYDLPPKDDNNIP